MSLSVLLRNQSWSPSLAISQHLVFVVSLLMLALAAQISGLDMWLAEQIFQSQNSDFLRHNRILELGFHQGGRYLVIVTLGYFLTRMLMSLALRSDPRVWAYLFFTTIACIVAVSALKQITRLPCPWDVQAFGGGRDYISVYSVFNHQFPVGHCFPSGHASGGFALFSFYFAFGRRNSRDLNIAGVQHRVLWLLPGILVGGSFAASQQLRGAHFLSHDVTTIALCWLICWGAQRFFFAVGKQ